MRVTVLRICPAMCKVFREETSPALTATGSAVATAPAPSSRYPTAASLSAAEVTVLQGVLETQRRRIMDTVDRAEELKLENLLDDLGCDQAIVDAMLVS